MRPHFLFLAFSLFSLTLFSTSLSHPRMCQNFYSFSRSCPVERRKAITGEKGRVLPSHRFFLYTPPKSLNNLPPTQRRTLGRGQTTPLTVCSWEHEGVYMEVRKRTEVFRRRRNRRDAFHDETRRNDDLHRIHDVDSMFSGTDAVPLQLSRWDQGRPESVWWSFLWILSFSALVIIWNFLCPLNSSVWVWGEAVLYGRELDGAGLCSVHLPAPCGSGMLRDVRT